MFFILSFDEEHVAHRYHLTFLASYSKPFIGLKLVPMNWKDIIKRFLHSHLMTVLRACNGSTELHRLAHISSGYTRVTRMVTIQKKVSNNTQDLLNKNVLKKPAQVQDLNGYQF